MNEVALQEAHRIGSKIETTSELFGLSVESSDWHHRLGPGSASGPPLADGLGRDDKGGGMTEMGGSGG